MTYPPSEEGRSVKLAVIEGFGYKLNIRMLELRVSRWVVRAFFRPWTWLPYAWRRWGVIAFGVGPIGVNILRDKSVSERP